MAGLCVLAKAPTRIDLAGGTLDIWPLNLMFARPATTVNMAISIMTHAAVTVGKARSVILVSEDQGTTVEFSSIEKIDHNHRLGLLSRLAQRFVPVGSGVKIVTRSEAPAGAGLAGSSALNIALSGALSRVFGENLSKHKIIDTAKDMEAALLGVPTGLQDYAAAVYGSLRSYRFLPGAMKQANLRRASTPLAKRVLLFYSGKSRLSGINNWEMFKQVIEKKRKTMRLFEEITECAQQAADALARLDMTTFDRAVRDEWKARARLFPEISTDRIDNAIKKGKSAGASAARICGAGGGGCFILVAEPDRHNAIISAVERAGCRRLPFSLSKTGLEIYNSRP